MKMIKTFCVLVLLSVASFSASAQEFSDDLREGYISDTPICFTVKNTADYQVLGDVKTAQDTREDLNHPITHTASFRLYQDESVPMCTTGPFFEGQKVRITLRTFVPIFECKTAVYEGVEILIRGKRGDGLANPTKTWVECL